jgi:hypothetical protein
MKAMTSSECRRRSSIWPEVTTRITVSGPRGADTLIIIDERHLAEKLAGT